MYEQGKVLVIGPDHAEIGRIDFWLSQHQIEIVAAKDWRKGLRDLYSEQPQAVVFLAPSGQDVSWSEIQVVRSLCDIPIVVIADSASTSCLHTALDLGLAGFMLRPVDSKKLTDRLVSALMKSGDVGRRQAQFCHENLSIDWRRFEVRVSGELVRLSPIEFKLLSLLVERRGEVVTYGEILSRVWGPHYETSERRNIKLYVWYLRQKIEAAPSHPRWIMTRAGIGYMFNAEPLVAALRPLEEEKIAERLVESDAFSAIAAS